MMPLLKKVMPDFMQKRAAGQNTTGSATAQTSVEKSFPPVDWVFIATVACLLIFGLIMVFSTTVGTIDPSLHKGANFRYFYMQMAYVFIGFLMILCMLIIPVNFWFESSRTLIIIAFFMLMLVLMPGVGREVNGSQRWIPLGPVNMQPSEMVKMIVVIYIAGFICRMGDNMQVFKMGILLPGIVLAVIAVLLLLEPDFGTTVVILVTAGTMLFLGGIRMAHTLMMLGVGGTLVTILAFSSNYRVERLMSFTNPWADPFDNGFQLSQALIAIGRGEWLGVGLGNSVQKLFYLPHAHNDFILAVVGEELGFIGILLLIVLFVTFVWRVLKLSEAAEKVEFYFGSRVCQGIAVLVGFQAIINIGVNLGALPTKGLTLPFLSYGGSSIVVTCMEVGLIFAIHKEVWRLNKVRNSSKKVRASMIGSVEYV